MKTAGKSSRAATRRRSARAAAAKSSARRASGSRSSALPKEMATTKRRTETEDRTAAPRARGVLARTREFVKANPKKSAMFAFVALGFLVRGLFKRGESTASD